MDHPFANGLTKLIDRQVLATGTNQSHLKKGPAPWRRGHRHSDIAGFQHIKHKVTRKGAIIRTNGSQLDEYSFPFDLAVLNPSKWWGKFDLVGRDVLQYESLISYTFGQLLQNLFWGRLKELVEISMDCKMRLNGRSESILEVFLYFFKRLTLTCIIDLQALREPSPIIVSHDDPE